MANQPANLQQLPLDLLFNGDEIETETGRIIAATKLQCPGCAGGIPVLIELFLRFFVKFGTIDADANKTNTWANYSDDVLHLLVDLAENDALKVILRAIRARRRDGHRVDVTRQQRVAMNQNKRDFHRIITATLTLQGYQIGGVNPRFVRVVLQDNREGAFELVCPFCHVTSVVRQQPDQRSVEVINITVRPQEEELTNNVLQRVLERGALANRLAPQRYELLRAVYEDLRQNDMRLAERLERIEVNQDELRAGQVAQDANIARILAILEGQNPGQNGGAPAQGQR